jgi:hypothetical protein
MTCLFLCSSKKKKSMVAHGLTGIKQKELATHLLFDPLKSFD